MTHDFDVDQLQRLDDAIDWAALHAKSTQTYQQALEAYERRRVVSRAKTLSEQLEVGKDWMRRTIVAVAMMVPLVAIGKSLSGDAGLPVLMNVIMVPMGVCTAVMMALGVLAMGPGIVVTRRGPRPERVDVEPVRYTVESDLDDNGSVTATVTRSGPTERARIVASVPIDSDDAVEIAERVEALKQDAARLQERAASARSSAFNDESAQRELAAERARANSGVVAHLNKD